MHWPRLFMAARHAVPAETSLQNRRDPADPIDLRKFDSLSPAEVSALPRRLRREVQADRKLRTTAALERFVAGGAR